MKKTDVLLMVSSLFYYKMIKDTECNEYVVYANSNVDCLEYIEDKTAF